MSFLSSFIENSLLISAQSKAPNIEDDGNEETRAHISDRIEGEEGARAAFATVSKLRLQNAELLGDTDPRYKGQKTSRKKIKENNEVEFDPELAKFCVVEEEDEDENDDDNESDDDDDDAGTSEDENKESDTEKSIQNGTNILKDDYMRMAEEDEELSDDEENEEEYSNEESDDHEDGDEIDDDDDVDDDKEDSKIQSSVQTFSKEDSSEMPKGIAVKNQCYIYDKLFEARIGLQKVSSISNQLPQASIYRDYLKNEYYPLYKTNLVKARKSVKKLILQILELQKCLLQNNSETKNIIKKENENKDVESGIESDNSDDDELLNGDGENKKSKGTKRKLEEFEEVLKKRHTNMIPFRNSTLNKWHEKAKLLGNRGSSGFGKFEISPIVQIKNVLANKADLVKRTQLKGRSRDTNEEGSHFVKEYDSEIFDDSDFYSRMLEEFLKSKMTVSDNMVEVSMHWMDIQKLRKKSKKKVEANASKGRKLRHQVIAKQQNFMAPAKHSFMSDEATNKLYTSLFGNNTVK